MVRFATVAIAYAFGMIVLAYPLRRVALQRGREHTWRNYIIGAVILAVVVAVVDTTSRIAVRQCFDAGNTSCVDFGSAGFQILITGGLVAYSWLMAFFIHND